MKSKNSTVPEDATTQAPVKMLPKSKYSKKDKLPETVEQVVGSAPTDEVQPRRRRGGRRAKDKGKGKEKAVEPVEDQMDVDNPGEDQPESNLPVSMREDADGTSREAGASTSAGAGSIQQGPFVQWSSNAPEEQGHARMDTTE